jgi:hypothetical protein
MTDAMMNDDETTYCTVHPDRETGLRCNRCGRLMCSECAVPTPIGYRCRECVREVDNTFFSSAPADPAIAFAIAAVGVAISAYLVLRFAGFLLLVFFIAIPIGGALAQLIHRAVGKRRGRYTAQAGAAGAMALLTGAFASISLWVMAGLIAALIYGRFQIK